MYEGITFEKIMQRMLDKIPPKIDKREGSVAWDCLAPAAIELQNMYIELDLILQETFADTASRDFLIKRAAERGIVPYPPTYALLKCEVFPVEVAVPIGTRFNCDELNYYIVAAVSDGVYHVRCETVGTVGNRQIGRLTPINYVYGLQSAQLTELLIPGEDEEETERIRQRYYDSLDAKAYGGNITDYRQKTNAIDGVGGVKVYPVWNGGGTVKLVIVDSSYNKPTQMLVDTLQEVIDPTLNGGKGLGIAPIGHVVTVESVSETLLDIGLNITYRSGWNFETIKPYIDVVIDEYLATLREKWESDDVTIVRISQIETRLLELEGVLDIADTTINGLKHNLTIDTCSIPVRGVTEENG